MSVLVKTEAIVKVIMTEKFRKRAVAELETLHHRLDEAGQRADFQFRAQLADLQKVDIQKAAALRRQWESERAEREDFLRDLQEKLNTMRSLPEGEEFVFTTMEVYLEAKENEPFPLFARPEIIIKDYKVVEVRTELPEGADNR